MYVSSNSRQNPLVRISFKYWKTNCRKITENVEFVRKSSSQSFWVESYDVMKATMGDCDLFIYSFGHLAIELRPELLDFKILTF
jgi:hypothetical protein